MSDGRRVYVTRVRRTGDGEQREIVRLSARPVSEADAQTEALLASCSALLEQVQCELLETEEDVDDGLEVDFFEDKSADEALDEDEAAEEALDDDIYEDEAAEETLDDDIYEDEAAANCFEDAFYEGEPAEDDREESDDEITLEAENAYEDDETDGGYAPLPAENADDDSDLTQNMEAEAVGTVEDTGAREADDDATEEIFEPVRPAAPVGDAPGSAIVQPTETAVKYTAHIALICDTAYVVPTCVAISSLARTAAAGSRYDVIVVTAELSDEARALLRRCAGERADVRIVTGSMAKFANLHIDSENTVRVASPAALLKFDLPTILPELEKLLYLDSDVIVRGDLSGLFATDLASGEYLIAAAADSGQVYFKHEYVDKVACYFNSGVMLMDLARMRAEGLPAKLLAEKQANPQSNLMDQNVFNVVMDGRVLYLEPRFNFLYMSLCNACQYYTIEQLNELFGTAYTDIGDIERTAVIIHYSSKNKPWKTPCTALSDEWLAAYSAAPCAGMPLERDSALPRPRFTVLVYIHNSGPYIERCVASLRAQTMEDFEVLLVENDSTDNSLGLAKKLTTEDYRLRWFRLPGGAANAVNAGLRLTNGERVLFLEGCETIPPDALERLDVAMTASGADMLACEPEIALSDRDGETETFICGEPPRDGDPLTLCLSCELLGWPRVYSRAFLEKNRLRFANNTFRGADFALRAARLATKAGRAEGVVVTRLFDALKKLSAGSGSFADMAEYAAQLDALTVDARYAGLARRRLDEAGDVYLAARAFGKMREPSDPPECSGAVEKALLRCGQLEQRCRHAEAQLSAVEARYRDVTGSTAYRLGMKATAAPRYIKRKLSERRGD